MRVIYFKKSIAIQIFLVMVLVCISLAYSISHSTRIIGVFSDKHKGLPIYSVEIEEKIISISFDAAWGDEYTPEILRILKERDIKTTFFLVGFWVDRYPDKVKQIDKEGHEVQNHTTNHPEMSKLSEQQIIDQLKITSDKIEALIGKRTTLFRPPFGDYNERLIQVAKDQGYYTIQWDIDSLDWKELGVHHMVEKVTKNVRNGSIVLFHNNAKYIVDALPIILDNLLEQGYRIVPISELIFKEDFYIDHTGRQFPIESKETQ